MKNKIVVRIEGGLGNQLFQYAFARQIQNIYGGEIIFDLFAYKKDSNNAFSLNKLLLKEVNDVNGLKNITTISIAKLWCKVGNGLFSKILNKEKRKTIRCFFGLFIQENTTYENYICKSYFPIKYISGNWMSEKYFIKISNLIKKEFDFTASMSSRNKDMYEQIKKNNSVCVHIRRGDYLNDKWSSKLMVCNYDYYLKGIDLIKEKITDPVFFIFSNHSDDILWIKENYCFDGNVVYVDLNNSDCDDFNLMKECKYFIISNSTYSWWASYLSKNINKIVVAPYRWNNGYWDMKDIYLDAWYVIGKNNCNY